MFNGKILAIANQKGGVGKTTTAINIATSIAAVGRKVLLIDLDSQGNAGTGLGINYEKRKGNTVYDVLLRGKEVEGSVIRTRIPRLDIITSDVELAAAEIELSFLENKEHILEKFFLPIVNNYDFIIIDCPPSLGLLTINALSFASGLLIPLQCEFFALEGLAYLLNTVKLVKQSSNPQLEIEGILLTMIDKRNNLSRQVEQDIRQTFGNLVFETMIPRNIKISEAPSYGKPALIYDMHCSGSIAYMKLVREIIKKSENNGYEERKASFG